MTDVITIDRGTPELVIVTEDNRVTEISSIIEPETELLILVESKAPTEILSVNDQEDEIQVIVGGNIGAPGPPGPQGLPGGAGYAESLLGGTTATVIHNLGKLDVLVQLYRESDGKQVGADIVYLSPYAVQINAAFDLAGHRVVILASGLSSDGGGPSGPVSYIHTQAISSKTWTVVHNLGYYPAATVEDAGGSVVYGSIRHIDTNSLVVTFSFALTGKCYCS